MERERHEAGRRQARQEMEADQQRERDRERAREWDRQQQQRRIQQREELLAAAAERERASRQPPNREYVLESFRDFLTETRELMDTPVPFTASLPAASQSPSDEHSARRQRSVRFRLDNPPPPFTVAGAHASVMAALERRNQRDQHIDVPPPPPIPHSHSAAVAVDHSGDADGTFDSFELRTWQPPVVEQPVRVVIRFFVYDRPGRLTHYAPSPVSALPSVIYTSTAVLTVSGESVSACATTSAVPLADSEGDGMRRGWMNSEWKSVSAAVMIDEALDTQHNGHEYTAVDYLYSTLRHRAAHGVKQEGEGETDDTSGLAVGGQLYMEDLTGEEEEEEEDEEGLMQPAVGETNVSSLPLPVKRRRVDLE